MFSVSCSSDSNCFRILAEDKTSLAGLSPILTKGCPNCKAPLSVSTSTEPKSNQIETIIPELIIPNPEDIIEWPLQGPFPNAISSTTDDGSRGRLLTSNTPHFLVSHAACDVLAELQQRQDYANGVPIKHFRMAAAATLSVVRKKLTVLEESNKEIRPRHSSGFPRHFDESTRAMLNATDADREAKTKKSANRFMNTVIGGYSSTGDEEGALYHQGLITLSKTDEGDVTAQLSQAGRELVSFENPLIHTPDLLADPPQKRYSPEESNWLITHTLNHLPDEAYMLLVVFSILDQRDCLMDDLVAEVKERQIPTLEAYVGASTTKGDAYEIYLRSLIQRWSAVGLFVSTRLKNRKSQYSVNENSELVPPSLHYLHHMEPTSSSKIDKFRRNPTFSMMGGER